MNTIESNERYRTLDADVLDTVNQDVIDRNFDGGSWGVLNTEDELVGGELADAFANSVNVSEDAKVEAVVRDLGNMAF